MDKFDRSISGDVLEERDEIRERIIKKVLEKHEKEFYCHVQFVVEIGLHLARKHKVDEKIIEISCLLHDIGRGNELDGESHALAGARISREFLKDFELKKEELDLILKCISNHNYNSEPETFEEKIVISADAASKVLYHEAFMLLCKKEGYIEKARWGLKYLKKSYDLILFEGFKEELKEKFEFLVSMYGDVLKEGD